MKSWQIIFVPLTFLAGCVPHPHNDFVYQTCATDLNCGLTTYLQLGEMELEWSHASDDGGWLYFTDPRKTDNVGVWEFAPSKVEQLKNIRAELALSAEFCGKGNPRGVRFFGSNWGDNAILVHQGDIVFSRRSDEPHVVYVMEIGRKDENWRVWVKYRIAERLQGRNPQWRAAIDVPTEDDRHVLGSGLRLSPEEARAALVNLLNSHGFLSKELDRQIATELKREDAVVIRRGIIVFDRMFCCDLRDGSFWFEFGSHEAGFQQFHGGSFQKDGNVWRAVITESSFGHGS